jgi:hopanoid biosynthesis associated protein HpnK
MRRLIINADDFGLTAGINRAVAEAHRNGILTSSTLMANGPAFEQAVEIARSSPRLSVGCHTVFVDGRPMLDSRRVPSLLASKTSSRFCTGLARFAGRALSGALRESEIEAEATAQIERLQAFGLPVTHVDTHKHTHIFPRVLRPLLRAAVKCGVGAVRNAFEPVRFSLLAERPRLWRRITQVKLMRGLAKGFRRTVHEYGMATPDGTLSIAATGALDQRLFRLLLEDLPEGTWEFVSHPGYNDRDLDGARTRLRESREEELQILTSPEARTVLGQAGIELISYRELAPAGGA